MVLKFFPPKIWGGKYIEGYQTLINVEYQIKEIVVLGFCKCMYKSVHNVIVRDVYKRQILHFGAAH